LEEGVLFLELIKVFIRNFRAYFGLVRSFLIAQVLPVDSFQEGVGLDLVSAVNSESGFGRGDHLFEQVCGFWGQVGFRWDRECFLVVQDLLAGDRGFVGEEGRVTHQHFKQNNAH